MAKYIKPNFSEQWASAGVTLRGNLYQYQTKTLVYKGSNTWKVVG